MATIPGQHTKANFDAATDDPKQARSEFAGNVDIYNNLRAWLITAFGTDDTPATILAHMSAYTQAAAQTAAQDQTGIYVATVAGTNTILLTASPTVVAYGAGQRFTFIAAAANTASVTINIDSLGAKTVKKDGGLTNLEAGDIRAGQIVDVIYDGVDMLLQTEPVASPAYLGAVAGTNTLTVTAAPAHVSYVTGRRYIFTAFTTNTGSVTLNVNSLGAKTLKKNGGADNLQAGDLIASQVVECIYDGTTMQVASPLAAGSGGMALVDSGTGTSVTGFSDTYDHYVLIIDSQRVDLRCRREGQGSEDSGASDYTRDEVGDSGSVNSSSAEMDQNNDSRENYMRMDIYGARDATVSTSIVAHYIANSGGNNFMGGTENTHNFSAQIAEIVLLTSKTFWLYGMAS